MDEPDRLAQFAQYLERRARPPHDTPVRQRCTSIHDCDPQTLA